MMALWLESLFRKPETRHAESERKKGISVYSRCSSKGEVYELFVKGYRPGVPLFLSGGDQVNVEITLLPEQVVECVFSGDRGKGERVFGRFVRN